MLRTLADDTTRDFWNGVNNKAARRIPRGVRPNRAAKANAAESPRTAQDRVGMSMAGGAWDPNRAIYIDFESLKQDPPRPGLLGVLTEGEGGRFEQLVLDPTLADGARARPHCRATSLPEAVAEIARRAGSEDRAIVGWSLFERTVIQKTDLPKTVKDGFVARYVNARAVASRWKSVVHPNHKLPKDDAFDTRNRLDRFAELTQYPGVTGLRGKPAAWLRRVTQRMAANDGEYRRLKPTVKSLWHRLLLYNEHDCRALAHIARRVTFELGKWREYEQTRFCIFDAPRAPLCFTVGSKSSRLTGLLDRHGVDRWALITAWNPASVELPREENDRRQEDLHSRLSNYIVIAGQGARRDATEPPEPSLMILGIPRKEAIRLGRSLGQLAVVAGHKGFPARLLPCSPLPKLSWTGPVSVPRPRKTLR